MKRWKYILEERIDGGRGGFADVYRGIRQVDGVEVAIKVLRNPNDTHARQAFCREVSLLRRLSHPHIVPVLDSNLESARPFYVMRLMTGGCLTASAVHSGADFSVSPERPSPFTTKRCCLPPPPTSHRNEFHRVIPRVSHCSG